MYYVAAFLISLTFKVRDLIILPMKTDDFINLIAPKLGDRAASDLVAMSNYLALKELLISKGIITQEELSKEQEKQLDKLSKITTLTDSDFKDI